MCTAGESPPILGKLLPHLRVKTPLPCCWYWCGVTLYLPRSLEVRRAWGRWISLPEQAAADNDQVTPDLLTDK